MRPPSPTESASVAGPVGPPPWRSAEAPPWLALAVVTLLYLLVILPDAVWEPWRLDEFFSRALSDMPLPAAMEATAHDLHPPLYYLILIGVRKITPEVWAIRGASVFIGWLVIVAAFVLGSRIGGRRTGFYFGLLLASLPVFTLYAKEARMYGLAILWEMLFVNCWLMRRSRPVPAWLGMGLCGAGALYSHNFAGVQIGLFAALNVVALLASLVRGRHRRAAVREILYLGSAMILTTVLYLPWLRYLLWQLQHAPLEDTFYLDDPIQQWLHLFEYAYWLSLKPRWEVFAWIPGIVILGVLPLARLIQHLRSRGAGQPEESGADLWIAWSAGWGPMLALGLASVVTLPFVAPERHSILFLPFALLPAARLMAALTEMPRMRLAPPVVLFFAGLIALKVSFGGHYWDYVSVREKIMDLAPPDKPVFYYPPWHHSGACRWMWREVPGDPRAAPGEIPVHLPDCALVVVKATTFRSEDILDRSRRTMRAASKVTLLFDSPDAALYELEGMPDGAVKSLVTPPRGQNAQKLGQVLGPWTAADGVTGRELQDRCEPRGQQAAFRYSGGGIKFSEREVRIAISPASGEQRDTRSLGCALINNPTGSHDSAVLCGMPGRPGIITVLNGERMLVADWVLKPEDTGLEIRGGEDLYLGWSGRVDLRKEDLAWREGAGTAVRIGVPGDELFIRSGFHAPEGAAPGEVRWSKKTFVVDFALWPGQQFDTVEIGGRLPPEITDRTIRVRVKRVADGETFTQGAGAAETAEHANHAIRLAQPLTEGTYRIEFDLGGDWVPEEHGLGGDPRRLGMRIAQIVLR